jgi:drug/metabolite transporter (DMT)-like permease
MTSSRSLRFKTFFLIAIMAVAGPLGNALLGKGMKHMGTVAAWPPAMLVHAGMRVFASGTIWLGVASLITFFLAYILVLSWADYSYVQPASSFSYAVVAFLGYFLLGESISPLRWVGIAVICMGVFVVGRTSPRSTPPNLESANLESANLESANLESANLERS